MLKIKEILDYEKIFDDENYNDVLEKIDNIPKELLIKASTFLLSFSSDTLLNQNHKELLSNWFSKENNKIANEINLKINTYIKEKKREIIIINPRASLFLFETILPLETTIEKIIDSELEVLLFKVYLAINQKLNENDKLIGESSKKNTDYPELINLSIGNSLPTFDISNFDILSVFICQTIKAIFFFEFLENQDEAKKLLNKFYEKFKVNGFKEYLGKILPVSSSIISAKKQGNISLNVENDTDYQKNIEFLETLTADPNVYESDKVDFINLRANPLVRINENTYQIIYPLFAIEKNFNGLYFLLKEINDSFTKTDKINLRQLVTYKFSEKYLLYKLLDITYAKKYIKLRGNQIETPGAPDYYMRNGNKIFIFESKDVLINASIKESYDFNQYEKELKEKLYYYNDGKKEQPKAVKQLVNFSRKLLTDSFNEDKNYKPKSIKLYPILVLHNRQLDILGLNNMINIWFEKEIGFLKADNIDISNLRRITIISIETILLFHEQLATGILKLEQIIDEYQDWIHEDKFKKKKFRNEDEKFAAIQDQIISFNMFLAIKYKWKPPKLFKEKAYSLVE